MERREEVNGALGINNVTLILSEIDNGYIEEDSVKMMALEMKNGVHGAFMEMRRMKRDLKSTMLCMLDKWWKQVLFSPNVDGVEHLIRILKLADLDYLAQRVITMKSSQPTDCEHCGNEMKGKDKSRLFCLCCSSHRVTTLKNSGGLANSLLDQFERKEILRESEKFLKDEYENLDGFQKHPEIFIPGIVKPCGEEMYNLINEEFQNDTCMVLHSYGPGISREVALEIFKLEKLKTSLENMENLRRLALVDDEIATDNLKEEHQKLKYDIENMPSEPFTLIVNLSLQCVVFCNLSPMNTKQFHKTKKYLEELQIDKHMVGQWRYIGFTIHQQEEFKSQFKTCHICKDHNFHIQGISGMRTKLEELMKDQCCVPLDKDESHRKRWQENYENFVRDIVSTSSMELLPYTHAVGKVIGLVDGIHGPGDRRFFTWNSPQKFIKDNPPDKGIPFGDFGTGKSMLLHHHLLTMRRDYPDRKNFLLSFLKRRGVLDVYNQLRYIN